MILSTVLTLKCLHRLLQSRCTEINCHKGLAVILSVIIQHCSVGIDLVPSKMITVDPNESKNVSFIMHSFHSVGKINYCKGSSSHSKV